MTDRFSNLTLEILTAKIDSTQVATIFLENWALPSRIPSYELTNYVAQFVSKRFTALCLFLGVEKLTTTTYHPQTKGQVEQYSRAFVARVRHYVSEHLRE